jgi:hypothetical protein
MQKDDLVERIRSLYKLTLMASKETYFLEKNEIAAILESDNYDGLNEKFAKMVNCCDSYFERIETLKKEKSPFPFDFSR